MNSQNNKNIKDLININNLLLIDNINLQDWLSSFNKHKKKDDLADWFLQGRWYLKNTILNSEEE